MTDNELSIQCTCDTQCDYELPPTFTYHVVEGNAPSVYTIFWIISSIALVVTAIIIIPKYLKVRAAAIEIRDKNDHAIIGVAHQVVMFTLMFPLLTVFGNFSNLLAPVVSLGFDFIISLSSAIVLFFFARLVIMYLGSFKSAFAAWKEDAPATKFYGAAPCCCLKLCTKESNMDKKDFRRIFGLIRQYMIILPFIKFADMFPSVQSGDNNDQWAGYIEMASSLLCLYGSQALLTASKDVLKEYNIDGKFKVIQFSVMALSLPSGIVGIIDIKGEDEVYTAEVMTTAYVSVITCCLYMLLSIGYIKVFNEQTAYEAYRNLNNQSFIDPKKEIKDEKNEKNEEQDVENEKSENDKDGVVNQENKPMVDGDNDNGRTDNVIELETQD